MVLNSRNGCQGQIDVLGAKFDGVDIVLESEDFIEHERAQGYERSVKETIFGCASPIPLLSPPIFSVGR